MNPADAQAGSILSGLAGFFGRLRVVERGRELGLSHPGVLAATVIAAGVDLVATPLATAAAWLDSSVGWLIDLALAPVAAVLCLPYLGRGFQWLWSVVLTAGWGLLFALDGVGALLGILPEKRLRLLVLVPGAEASPASQELLQGLRVAADIFRRQANVRLMPAVAWEFAGSFSPSSTPDVTWLKSPVGGPLLQDVGCAGQAMREDLGPAGAGFAWCVLRTHPFGIARRLLGIGAPIVALTVNSVQEGRLVGCSLGPLTDYVTILAGQSVCLAHELGHACNLLHVKDSGNLMFPTCGGTHLTRGQIALIRLSRHVSYF